MLIFFTHGSQTVIQAVDPWMSAELQKGARWGTEVAKTLEQSRFGIVCLTKENLNENWILFEAGALSKATDGNVWTLLLISIHPTFNNRLHSFNIQFARRKTFGGFFTQSMRPFD